MHISKYSRRSGKVLVLGTDQRVVLAIARSLGRQGLTVHIGWCSGDSIVTRSRYVSRVYDIPTYAPNDDRWKDVLLAILARETFDLVIPCNDSTLVPLIANRADFAGFPQIYLLPDRTFSIVSDKFNTYRLALAESVNVPRGCVTDGSANPDRIVEEFGLPLVVKPQCTVTADSAGVANVVRKVNNRDELLATLEERGSQKMLVQENFIGVGVGVEMLVLEGQVLFAFQHARIHETVEWGSSYRESVEVAPQLLEAARRVMTAVGYTGVAMAEFIVDPRSGSWVFLEINGRFWGSLPLAVAAGADFPFYLYQMLVEGKRRFADEYRMGVRCRNLPLDLGWMRTRFGGRGWRKLTAPLRMAAELGSILVHRDHLDSLSLDDPFPFFVELVQLAGSGWRKVNAKASLSKSFSAAKRRRAREACWTSSVAEAHARKPQGLSR